MVADEVVGAALTIAGTVGFISASVLAVSGADSSIVLLYSATSFIPVSIGFVSLMTRDLGPAQRRTATVGTATYGLLWISGTAVAQQYNASTMVILLIAAEIVMVGGCLLALARARPPVSTTGPNGTSLNSGSPIEPS